MVDTLAGPASHDAERPLTGERRRTLRRAS
jgi:hypothetical protein